jgi:type II secretory pathway pseudopilin PulG
MDKKGFTMVQLIITLGVLAVLATATMIAFDPIRRMGQANDARRYEDVESMAKALELYQIDNDQLPSDFTDLNIWDTHKVVLCSSAAELTCDGQTRDCLVVDDTDFLGEYLPELPIDPTKRNDADTGYYVTRDNDRLAFGVCNTYDDEGIEYVAKIALVAYNASCGDGEVEGDEVCDDGDNDNEGCGNGVIDFAGTYCNSDCSAEIVIDTKEPCDYLNFAHDCFHVGIDEWVTESTAGSRWCDASCSQFIDQCLSMP